MGMKALVLKAYKQLEYSDVPEPIIGNSDVLVKIKSCGICGSDVHGFDGSTGRRIPPVVMGHEAAGIISDVGKNVSDWKAGERITFDSTIYCGNCFYCKRGQINLCDNRRVLGVSCKEYHQDGAFAEYVAIPQRVLYRIPDDLTFEKATMIETLSIAVHAIGRTVIPINSSVMVIGAGIIGTLVIGLLRRVGCGKIYAVDIDSSKAELAHQYGADEFLISSADLPNQIQQLTKGGVDLAFDAVGNQSAFITAVASVRKSGSVILIGNLSPNIQLPLQTAVTRELKFFGSCASSGEYPACIDLLSRNHIDIEPLISHVAPLAEGQMWFERLYSRESNLKKVILNP